MHAGGARRIRRVVRAGGLGARERQRAARARGRRVRRRAARRLLRLVRVRADGPRRRDRADGRRHVGRGHADASTQRDPAVSDGAASSRRARARGAARSPLRVRGVDLRPLRLRRRDALARPRGGQRTHRVPRRSRKARRRSTRRRGRGLRAVPAAVRLGSRRAPGDDQQERALVAAPSSRRLRAPSPRREQALQRAARARRRARRVRGLSDQGRVGGRVPEGPGAGRRGVRDLARRDARALALSSSRST